MAKITFVLEDGQEVVVPVDGRVSVGRGEGNDVVVDDARVSERHAEIIPARGAYDLRDLRSESGTMVNGARVERASLKHGDRVEFGPLIGLFETDDPPKKKPAKKAAARGTKPRTVEAPAPAEPVPLNREMVDAETAKLAAELDAAKVVTKAETAKLAKELDADRVASAAETAKLAAELDSARSAAAAEAVKFAAELDAARAASRAETGKLEQLHAEIQAAESRAVELEKRETEAEARFREAAAARVAELKKREAESGERLREAADELSAKHARLEKLEEEQKALAHVTEALRETRAKHDDWTEALRILGEEHENKNLEVQKLGVVLDGVRREVETVNAHREETMGHLQQLHADRAALDAQLAELGKVEKESEARGREMKALLEARADSLAGIERKIGDLEHERAQREAHIAELAGAEDRLASAQAQFQETKKSQAELTAELEKLDASRRELEAKTAEMRGVIAGLEDRRDEVSRNADAARVELEEVNARLTQMKLEREQGEQGLLTLRTEMDTAARQLDESKQRRAELDRQCRELSGTEQQLAGKTAALEEARGRHAAIETAISEIEQERGRRRAILDDLCSEEEAAKGRLEVLRGQEHDLRGALELLSGQERTDRARFEEIRKLAVEMEQEHAAQKTELTQSIETTRRELADLELKLAPLRDWKESMDRRYARLAALPEDSAEARDLWREIENEKASLKTLISTQAGQTRSVSLREAVLQNLTGRPEDEDGRTKEKLHAPPGLNRGAASPEERANVGPAGTGAMYSGTGQEMALKARLNRLRESVQREAVRLEFLRQERSREEGRLKTQGSHEPAMREQDRQLESKIRRDEERFAAVERKLELAAVEEEKRREKIAEMEHRLAELRADIAEADQQRSDFRHQADMAHKEFKNIEAALERVKKLGD